MGFPTKNVICMWSGALASIPPGWLLCDGAKGTPNLLGLFVKEVATSTTNPGTTGGATSHSHTNAAHTHTTPNHSHTTGGPSDISRWPNDGGLLGNASAGHTHATNTDGSATLNSTSITVDSASHEPPYFKLAYIMKAY